MTHLGLRSILFDLDGVLYNAAQPIAYAAEVVAWVKRRGIPHLFVTNTTSRGRAALVDKLARFGVTTEESRIFTPPAAAAAWLRFQPSGAVALFVPAATRSEFEGLPYLLDEAESGASYIVIGDLAERWDYRTLNRAFRLLHNNPRAQLIALGMTRYWLAPGGISLLHDFCHGLIDPPLLRCACSPCSTYCSSTPPLAERRAPCTDGPWILSARRLGGLRYGGSTARGR